MTRPICGKAFQEGILDGEATVCGRNPFHGGACGKWTASTERDGDTITIIPEAVAAENVPARWKSRVIQIRFAGEGPDLTFVEVEDRQGRGLSVGTWEKDGEYHLLVIEIADDPQVHDPADRFSEDALGADGKAFIAVAMETTKTRCHVAPFSVSIEVEAARSKLTLSFESPNDALVWITNLRNLIAGKLRPVDEDTEQ